MLNEKYLLGLDLGVASIGWTAMTLDEQERPAGLLDMGVRIFDMMGDTQPAEYSAGMDASPAESRRVARLRRRQVQRSAKRRARILVLLQKYGLLPQGEVQEPLERMKYFCELDESLISKWYAEHSGDYAWRNSPDLLHVFPYKLRSAAITEPLEPFAFGRALYHLAQRRGFKSNRREEALLQAIDDGDTESLADAEVEKELGVIKGAIKDLEDKMCQAGAATVGQFLATLSPSQTRIRARHTSRDMISREFTLMWERQRVIYAGSASGGRYPDWLAYSVEKALQKAIFFQRPLKSQKNLVGYCSLEPGQRRASMNCPEAQEFRLLQKLNDLAWVDEELVMHRVADDQSRYDLLYSALMRTGSMRFTAIRKLLNLPRSSKFNFELDKESQLTGNLINARMFDAFGEAWHDFGQDKQAAILHDLSGIQKLEVLKRRALDVWGLDEGKARKFIRGFVDDAYCALSKKALRKLLPEMRKGEQFGKIRHKLYPPQFSGKGFRELPPVLDVMDSLRNPAVIRTLSQLRKVINGLVRKYGRPHVIRVELARDMKNGRKDRKKLATNNRAQEKLRKSAAQKLEEKGIHSPRRADIEKLLLAEECGWRCPYTGESIGWTKLFGKHPSVEVEHILPYSKVFDNSFMNKTLCYTDYNRKKGNRIPYDAAGGDTEEYEAILNRVRAFHTNSSNEASVFGAGGANFHNALFLRRSKLERFMAKDLSKYEGFVDRMLNDTRHASRVAMEYLAMLYGEEAKTRRCVQAGRGGVTSILRGAWNLNSILNDGGSKSRDDHRHHAVDATTIACTSPALMQRLQTIAAAFENDGQRFRFYGKLEEPWDGFQDDIRKAVMEVVPSVSVRHKARGALHNENPYAKRVVPGSGQEVFSIRKDVKNIKTDKVDSFLKSVFSDDKNLKNKLRKEITGQTDKALPGRIRAVRVTSKPGTTVAVGDAPIRVYSSKINHHTPIFSLPDGNREKWSTPGPVMLFDAIKRVERGLPLIDRNAVPGGKYLFSLASGDCIEIIWNGTRELLKIRTAYLDNGKFYIEANRITDARTKDVIRKGQKDGDRRDFFKLSLAQLQSCKCRKIRISPTGRVTYCNE